MSRIKMTLKGEALNPRMDALGKSIAIGDTVRSFDFAMDIMDDGTLGRTETTGEYACFVVGIVEEISVFHDGCKRYRIRPIMRRFGGEDSFFAQDTEERFYPPVNGVRNMLGGFTAGVFRVETKGA